MWTPFEIRKVQDFAHAERVWRGFQPLTNRISPLLRPHSFKNIEFHEANSYSEADIENGSCDMPYWVYQRMLPGLRLFTTLLYCARPILLGILCAPFICVAGHDRECMCAGGRLEDNWEPSRRDHQTYDHVLDEMEDEWRIYYSDPEHHLAQTRDYVGITSISDRPVNNKIRIRSALCVGILHEVAAGDWYNRHDTHRLHCLFVMAVVLLHEFAHALYKYRFRQLQRRMWGIEYLPEPFFHHEDTYAELGQALEIRLFGGIIQFPNSNAGLKYDGSCGAEIFIRDAQLQPSVWAIADETVRSLFDRRTWTKSRRGRISTIDFCIVFRPNVLQASPIDLFVRETHRPNHGFHTPAIIPSFPPSFPTNFLVAPPGLPAHVLAERSFLQASMPSHFLSGPPSSIPQPPRPSARALAGRSFLQASAQSQLSSRPSSSIPQPPVLEDLFMGLPRPPDHFFFGGPPPPW